jgi:hypothetical protein
MALQPARSTRQRMFAELLEDMIDRTAAGHLT